MNVVTVSDPEVNGAVGQLEQVTRTTKTVYNFKKCSIWEMDLRPDGPHFYAPSSFPSLTNAAALALAIIRSLRDTGHLPSPHEDPSSVESHLELVSNGVAF
jgi:hypothetical protein